MPFRRSKLSKNNVSDLEAVQRTILRFNFDQSAHSEREFELAIGSTLAAGSFSRNVVTQSDRRTPVLGVHCFGKKHRPDMTIGQGHIAIELKYLKKSTNGFRDAIGQAYLYRLRYRFVVVVLVLGPELKHVYKAIAEGGEDDLETVLAWLAAKMKVFTYVAPAFRTRREPRVLAFHTLSPGS